MKHVVAGAYKDALHNLRAKMMGHTMSPDDEDEEQEGMGNTPEGMEPQAKSDAAEGELGISDHEEAPAEDRLSDEEKREQMYGRRGKPPGHPGLMVVIGMGKKGAGKGKK